MVHLFRPARKPRPRGADDEARHIVSRMPASAGLFDGSRGKPGGRPEIPVAAHPGHHPLCPGGHRWASPAIEGIEGAARKVLENHETYVKERLENFGAQADFLGSGQYAGFLATQCGHYGGLVKSMKP